MTERIPNPPATGSDIAAAVAAQHAFFATDATKPYAWRIAKLKALKAAINAHEQALLDALYEDLHKAPTEGYLSEVGMVLDELSATIRHLRGWMRPQHVGTSLANFPARSRILSEPYGVVLVMAPWNYPFLLSMEPLIGAVAAGNCVVLKPSNHSPRTSAVMKELIDEVFDPENGMVVLGGHEENTDLLEQRFDYIFFTGGVRVGGVVMQAAARHLTPVTLELGGKSPCIVDETAPIALAAKRIAWGKFLNAGQTCVAPDYVYVHESVKDAFIAAFREATKRLYGADPLTSDELPKIVNAKHFTRLQALLRGEHCVMGGRVDEATMRIEPTLLDDITWDAPIMQEEIFGPLLPVLTYRNLDEVIDTVKAHAKPLALYLFTSSEAHEKAVLSAVSFGGGCINDTIVHLASTTMPFGGVGGSGMGGYHGPYSFATFSHRKSILKKSNLIDVPVRYAPYKKKLALLKLFMH